MGTRKQRWCSLNPPLTPLIEGPDSDQLREHGGYGNKSSSSSSSWDLIRDWFRTQKGFNSSISPYPIISHDFSAKCQDLKLLLGVLGCPLAPIPLLDSPNYHLHIRDIPIETSMAKYIIQQYMAASGCLKQGKGGGIKNMYATGTVKMICCETEVSTGKGVKSLGSRSGSLENGGCFLLWQMSPGMWSLELCVSGNKIVAGSNGKIVWRHTPWLGTHAAKGPRRPLRRIIQGLDPKSTASLFTKAQCLGEKQIGNEDCFVLKVAADHSALKERNEGPAEVIRHVLYGYFSQRSGLLIYLEDSHLTRVQQSPGNDTVYWETTIGTSIGDYRDVDGVMIAHQGRTVATVFRFGELSMKHSRTRMEEMWRIDDVVFNVHGLSMDYFIPPADIFAI